MLRIVGIVLGVVLLLAVAGLAYVRVTGLRASVQPAAWEATVARAVRGVAIPAAERNRSNPVAPTADALATAMEHWADHCATCHANDGSGQTDFGRGMYPPPPDMRLEGTQRLTDGELFYIIEHGIRFTGMPAFGTGHADDAEGSWQLVHFIRHLPKLTEAELERMREMNPRSPAEIRQEIEEERFLRGEP
jgi:mono/diheme cytochrome c family protein